MRAAWAVTGLLAVGAGGVGVVVPGLPTTVFFIAAAACFSRSSPRLEQWVLDLPRIGPMVRDHRAGLGMPRRAKVIVAAMVTAVVSLSAMTISSTGVRLAVLALGAIGVAYVAVRVPTRERVIASRSSAPST